MDHKIKLFAVASVVAVLVSGCSGYDNNQGDGGSNGYSSSQNAGSGQVSNNNTTCTPCATKPRTTYTYKPKPRVTYKPKPRVKGSHNQQYYIDRWNSQQNKARTTNRTTNRTVHRPAAKTNNTNNSGYGNGYYTPNTASSTTYYDYSSAAKKKNTNTNTNTNNTASLSTSNKSIYTGSYQKRTYKPYKPTTYAAGGNSKKQTNYSVGTSTRSGGSAYTVKKGDTVFEIMRQTGVYWKDIIRINNLSAPYNISPGQSIRLK